MLKGHNLDIMDSQTPKDFRKHVVRFGRELGFNTINALTIVDQPEGPPKYYSADNTPVEYLKAYHDPTLGEADPVMQHCKRTHLPIRWDQSTYVKQGRASLWEFQAGYGYQTGLAVAIHMVGGLHFFVGVDRDKPLPPAAHVDRMINDLTLFAAHAQDTAIRIFSPLSASWAVGERPTDVEIDVLRWAMDGISTFRIGELMKLSETVVSAHMLSAIRKLHCVNRYHAIIKAIRLGYIK